MLDAVYQACPRIKFALLGGDLTDNGDDDEEWGQFLDAATGVFSRIPVMPAMGNHDGSMYLDFLPYRVMVLQDWSRSFTPLITEMLILCR